jgi:predicted DNA-binding protein (MmcQ/YjbR family)
MDIETFRSYCLSLKGVTEELPFDENTLVFKVMGKMFTATDIMLFESINVKCDPEIAIELREQYKAVLPGYHMNKKHWNTILMNGEVSDAQIKAWVLDSYHLVVNNLSKKEQESLKNLD